MNAENILLKFIFCGLSKTMFFFFVKYDAIVFKCKKEILSGAYMIKYLNS